MTEERIWQAIEMAIGRQRPALLTLKEFATVMHVSYQTAYRMVHTNNLQVIHLMGTIRVPVSEVFNRLNGTEDLAVQ